MPDHKTFVGGAMKKCVFAAPDKGFPHRNHLFTRGTCGDRLLIFSRSAQIDSADGTGAVLGYSKTVTNLRHAVALFIAHFNYCRVHSAHGKTPAQAAMLTKDVWTVERLIEECGKY